MALSLDWMLTNQRDPESYIALGLINGDRAFSFDLRPWGQKFAFYYREWELPHVEALRRLYRGGVFLDIGSSIGLYPVSLGREIVRAGGSIVSIEPAPGNVSRQRANLALNGLEEVVTLLEVGLGSSPGDLKLRIDPSGADNNAIISVDGSLSIPIRRLDDVLTDLGWPCVTLIKMDVEGWEPEVIAGGRESIRRDMPIIFAEFCRERMRINHFSMRDSWTFLQECGYRCFRLARGRFEPLESPGEFEDLYFIPESVGDPNMIGI
jgi:FkbM family methyltransferase